MRQEKNAFNFFTAEIEKNSLLFVSVISRVEIFAGMRKGEEEAVTSFFEIITPINVDVAIADRAGEYLRKFSKSHDFNIGDVIIAAISREMALKLVTRNVKHYPMNDIEVIRPY